MANDIYFSKMGILIMIILMLTIRLTKTAKIIITLIVLSKKSDLFLVTLDCG